MSTRERERKRGLFDLVSVDCHDAISEAAAPAAATAL